MTFVVFMEKYNAIIVFVWDNSRKIEQHFEFKQGLCKVNANFVEVFKPKVE